MMSDVRNSTNDEMLVVYNRNVVFKDSQVYIQSLEDKTIECGFYLLDLDYVEIIKE